jgi:Mor family transcriptional regulator
MLHSPHQADGHTGDPLVLDNAAIKRDREHGQSLRQIAKGHQISTATVQRVLRMPPDQRKLWKRSINQPEPASFTL